MKKKNRRKGKNEKEKIKGGRKEKLKGTIPRTKPKMSDKRKDWKGKKLEREKNPSEMGKVI